MDNGRRRPLYDAVFVGMFECMCMTAVAHHRRIRPNIVPVESPTWTGKRNSFLICRRESLLNQSWKKNSLNNAANITSLIFIIRFGIATIIRWNTSSIVDLYTNGCSILFTITQVITFTPIGHFPFELWMACSVVLIGMVLIVRVWLEVVVAVLCFIQSHREWESNQFVRHIFITPR